MPADNLLFLSLGPLSELVIELRRFRYEAASIEPPPSRIALIRLEATIIQRFCDQTPMGKLSREEVFLHTTWSKLAAAFVSRKP